ncbi:MAG: helix-turn-helix domain-containing protein [Nanoarchaeota archaeon]|nr:helix-turn-helix domain-containing protein [Nanoarchaeota archaeon]MBU0977418.1 helix-turn-helix domain-containing protein [Nanoarchaeota archaeon]
MTKDKIKEAFQKVKEDMNSLKDQLESLTRQIDDLKRTIRQTDKPTDIQTGAFLAQTQNPALPTDHPAIPTLKEKDQNKGLLEALKPQKMQVSTGNRGVPADRQTNRQTDQQTDNYLYQFGSNPFSTQSSQKFALKGTNEDPVTRIGKVAELINSLDSLKKDLRKQFKRLTPQEMLVFSTIYQLTDQAIDVDYSLLSKKTNLTESSIRDYVQKLIKKGIPLEKTRENNKRILLIIAPEFKRIASLDTLISLRNL